jgi:hypothetical protein
VHRGAVHGLDIACGDKMEPMTQKISCRKTLLDQIAYGLIGKIGSGPVVETCDLFQRLIETGIDFSGEDDLVHRIEFPFSQTRGCDKVAMLSNVV